MRPGPDMARGLMNSNAVFKLGISMAPITI